MVLTYFHILLILRAERHKMSEEQILDLVDTTLAWGSEVAEMWAGTQYQEYIDSQQTQVISAVEHKDFEKIRTLVYDLAQTLTQAEKEYND